MTTVNEAINVEFRADFFHVLNRHPFGYADSTPTDPGFVKSQDLDNKIPGRDRCA